MINIPLDDITYTVFEWLPENNTEKGKKIFICAYMHAYRQIHIHKQTHHIHYACILFKYTARCKKYT